MHKWLTVAVICIVFSEFAPAQMSPGTMLSWSRGPLSGPGFGFRSPAVSRAQARSRGAFFWGDPFFYSDEAPISLASEAPSFVPVMVNAPAPEPTAEPLLIEWKGDRFVRSGGGANERDVDYVAGDGHTLSSSVLAPATLVFRDGHQQKVSDYVIAQGALYARSDYPNTGVWTETIQLSALDLPATVRLNQQNGVKFVLPGGPNEVVTRP